MTIRKNVFQTIIYPKESLIEWWSNHLQRVMSQFRFLLVEVSQAHPWIDIVVWVALDSG